MDPRRLDEIAAAATVSPIEAEVEGWWCKAAPDLPFRRCNVTLPPVAVAEDRMVFVDGLDQVRRWYHERRLRLIVQVSSALPKWDLVDDWLAAAGLGVEAPVHVMTTEYEMSAAPSRSVDVGAGIDEAWSTAFGTVFGGSPAEVTRTQAYGRMLTAFGDRALGASVRDCDRIVGVGYGVLADGWLGIFGMGTSTAHRRQGVASSILAALRTEARARGVDRAYLQVETDNTAAIRLYERSGFAPSHGYHYRSEAEPPA